MGGGLLWEGGCCERGVVVGGGVVRGCERGWWRGACERGWWRGGVVVGEGVVRGGCEGEL